MPKLYIEIDAPYYDDDYLSYIDAVLVLEHNNQRYELFVFDLEDKEESEYGRIFLKSLGFQKTEEFDWEEEVIEIAKVRAEELLERYKKSKNGERAILYPSPDYVIPVYREEVTTINLDGSITKTTTVKTIPISPG